MSLLAVLAVWALSSPAQVPDWPQTRAERTHYAETSHYSDVIDFLQGMQRAGAPISIKWMGTSVEGKAMPLVIASRPLVSNPTEAKATGKPIIYIEANIHAGEVEGKEAALALLRRYCQDKSGLLDKVIILMTPIYNIDGNEKFGPQAVNRPGQTGPELVGVRPNGGGLDLNRDCMKAESPEMRGVLKYVYPWDPDVVLDLHTTDGSRHGYQLTYAPDCHPNTDPDVLKFSRDELLPGIRKQVAKGGLRLFDYGNMAKRDGKPVWETFGYEGRYVTNYAGLRGRISVLSEAMTHETFERRVADTETFVDAVLQVVAKQGKRVVEMTRNADRRVVEWGNDPSKAPELGVRFDMVSRGEEGVLMEKPGVNAGTAPVRDFAPIQMQVYDRFGPTRKAKFPGAYLIPASETRVVDLLRLHGVKVEQLIEAWHGDASRFTLSEVNVPRNAFQGHKLVRLEGSFGSSSADADKGWYVVRTAQPLGVLAFDLLEPESLDGVTSWGFLGEDLKVGDVYPILKVFVPVRVATIETP